ncbi:MAG: acetate--CoA ligase family protein [Actinobacteria bacterium]|nr:acetate--CoA ligase family protein [Actinomycetota bacterium]
MNAVDHAPAPTSLARLLAPQSIAVVGASASGRGFGARVVQNLRDQRFGGDVYVINPNAAGTEMHGFPVYPDLAGVPGSIDAAVLAVASTAIPQVLEACGEKGVRLAVVISAGFAELGEVDREATLSELVEDGDLRILGPNCLGFINVSESVAATASGAVGAAELIDGGVSFVTQSGGVGITSVFARALEHGVGFRRVVSTGNEADLGAAELIEAMIEDPETKVVAAFLEQLREPARFSAAAKKAAVAQVPLVALKVGRTGAGARAAATHTAALVGSDRVVDAIFRTHGVIRVDDIDELWRVAGFLAQSPLPRGNRVGVLGTSGGMNGVLADQLSLHGLELPDLAAETEARLRELLPAYAGIGNPLDITGAALGLEGEARLYADLLEAMNADPSVDLIVAMMWGGPTLRDDLEVLTAAVEGFEKPVAVVCPGVEEGVRALAALERSPIGLFTSPSECAAVLGHAVRYRAFLDRIDEAADEDAGDGIADTPAAPSTVSRDPWEMLAAYGISGAPSATVGDAPEAVEAAGSLGYPVAIKLDDPEVMHKTEVGGVHLDLRGPAEVTAAVESLRRGFPDSPLVVQSMVSGIEVLIGVQHDPQFGPVIAVGAGGTLVELLSDTVLALPPLSERDVIGMLGELRLKQLLDGVRGAGPADVGALARAVSNVARLALDLGDELESLDINPIVVLPQGEGTAVLDVAVEWR